MKISNVPTKMGVVFGVNGQRQDLLADTVSGEPNASYNAGFPPITMIAKSAGGQAPLGKDFNQIFYELSADAQWSQASGVYPYDATFSTAIGGYPKGAVVLGSDNQTLYQNTVDDNTASPGSDDTWYTLPGNSSNYDYFAGEYSSSTIKIDGYNQFITYNGVRWYVNPNATIPFDTTGTDSSSWISDSSKFIAMGDYSVREELENIGILNGFKSSSTYEYTDPSSLAKIEFGSDDDGQKGFIKILSGGIVKSGSVENGVDTSIGCVMPYVMNTGNVISTSVGTFAEKQVFFPSDKYEDSDQSPSIGITYNSSGLPEAWLISPIKTTAGGQFFPSTDGIGTASRRIAFKDNTAAAPSSLGQVSTNRYIQIAKWTVTSTPWNTEYKAVVISSNTDDRFVGSMLIEANVQASGTTLATAANITQANISKYFNVNFDGPSDRLPYASGTSFSVPTFGVSTDGTYLYLWVLIQGGFSSSKLTEIHKGTGTSLTTDYTLSNVLTSAPSGYVTIPMSVTYNGNNSSMANDGRILSVDNHVRICNSSGSYSARTDIQKDGFLWGGYGTYKSNRQSCTITKSSTGVYVVTGPHSSAGWNITQPYDSNGEQVAIARVTSTSSDGLTNTISVYAIKYTYDSTAGTVTRGIGDLTDIPSGSWVDFHASTTF